MAWKAKTLARTLMTVAFVKNLGPLSAMTNRFGSAKALLEGLFEHPAGDSDSVRDLDMSRIIECQKWFFNSLLKSER